MPDKRFQLKDIPWSLRRPKKPRLRLRALEPRYMFDAELLVSAAQMEVLYDLSGAKAASVDSQKTAAAAESKSLESNDTPVVSAPVDDRDEVDHVSTDLSTDEPVAPAAPLSVAFVDTSVRDWQQLVGQLDPSTLVVRIDGESDGLAQVSAALADLTNVGSVAIISHGYEGQLLLGSTRYTSESLAAREAELRSIAGSLTADADILLYGCEIGAGSAGAAFVDLLAEYTDADVAASDDMTGADELGGDWTLEYSRGRIDYVSFGEGTIYGDLLAASPTGVNDTLTINEDASGSVNVLDNDLARNGQDLQNTNPNAVVTSFGINNASNISVGVGSTVTAYVFFNSANSTYSISTTDGATKIATVAVSSNGLFVYTPAANRAGTQPQFIYRIDDRAQPAAQGTGYLTVNVTAVNDAPVALDDSLTISEGTGLTSKTGSVTGTGLLGNDTDADGDTLRVTQFVIGANPAFIVADGGSKVVYLKTDGSVVDTAPSAGELAATLEVFSSGRYDFT
ncbi:MAG: hypothetical protein RL749_378, partial [Verrucomicrobiota bacterium]